MDPIENPSRCEGKPPAQTGQTGNQTGQPQTAPPSPRYKPSRFNAHITTEDGTLILYNGFTGHNCAIPARSADRVFPYLSRKGFAGSLDELGHYLLRHGYIVEDVTDENARWDVRYGLDQYRNDILDLILLSSEDCNFRCVYCSQQFKRGGMLPHVRRGVVNLVRSKIKRLWVLHIAWYGGEPMLAYDAIEEMAPLIQTMSREYGVRYFSDITTNGYLLTPERSRAMVAWGITAYQITVDGAGEIHDRHRPLKGGGSTYEQIMSNVTAMKAIPEDFRVFLRTNYDRTNMDRLMPLFEEFRARLGCDPRFIVRLQTVNTWGGPNDDQLDVCGELESLSVYERLIERARSLGLPVESESVGSLAPTPRSVCYAARPYSFVVGADGKLMKCTVVLDTEEQNVVGHLKEDGELRIDDDHFAAWVRPYYKEDPMCSKCFFVPACQSAFCPLPRVREGKRLCPAHKIYIHRTLKRIRGVRVRAGTTQVVRIANFRAQPREVCRGQRIAPGP